MWSTWQDSIRGLEILQKTRYIWMKSLLYRYHVAIPSHIVSAAIVCDRSRIAGGRTRCHVAVLSVQLASWSPCSAKLDSEFGPESPGVLPGPAACIPVEKPGVVPGYIRSQTNLTRGCRDTTVIYYNCIEFILLHGCNKE
jgi:hypothetical protein